jgi:hypothetical protein
LGSSTIKPPQFVVKFLINPTLFFLKGNDVRLGLRESLINQLPHPVVKTAQHRLSFVEWVCHRTPFSAPNEYNNAGENGKQNRHSYRQPV